MLLACLRASPVSAADAEADRISSLVYLLRKSSMGAMVSALVFQPPPTTYGFTRRYFFLATSMYNRIPAFYIPQE